MTRMISIRMDQELIKKLKKRAQEKRMPYQTMIKEILQKFVKEKT